MSNRFMNLIWCYSSSESQLPKGIVIVLKDDIIKDYPTVNQQNKINSMLKAQSAREGRWFDIIESWKYHT